MCNYLDNAVKTGLEIGRLACELDQKGQIYVLNTINALLFAKEVKSK